MAPTAKRGLHEASTRAKNILIILKIGFQMPYGPQLALLLLFLKRTQHPPRHRTSTCL